MTRGTHVKRATLAVRTTQASRLAATGTSSLDNKTSASSDDDNSKIPCYFGGFPKIRGCLLFVLWPWPKQEKLSLFFSDGLRNIEDAHQMDSVLVSELDV